MSQTWRLEARSSLRPVAGGRRARDEGEHQPTVTSAEQLTTVGGAPAEVLPEPRGRGHARQVGDREAEHHPADRPAPPGGATRLGRDQAAIPKKAPCGRPATKRPPHEDEEADGAAAVARLATA